MGQLEQKIGELPFSLIRISRNLSNQLLAQSDRKMTFRSVDGAVVGIFLEPLGRTKHTTSGIDGVKSDAQPPEGDYMKFVLTCLNRLRMDSQQNGSSSFWDPLHCPVCLWVPNLPSHFLGLQGFPTLHTTSS